MKEILIGRTKEQKDLHEWIETDRSEFIAIYGRRRVGKTFLVKKTIGDNLSFYFTGSHGISRKDQLLNFGLALRNQFGNDGQNIPENWIYAFDDLARLLEKSKKKQKIIFLDELPWIDTPKSGFLPALEHFWNSWAVWRNDIKLIVCGSATSWIINKIIRNRGGLHNRVTHLMQLSPFQLKECEEYFHAYGFRLSRMQIAECYMTMGGIPYYFSLMNQGESLAQNIDRLFFYNDAPLKNEFDDIYKALYKNYRPHIKVVKALAEKGKGLTRQEIIKKTRLINNGSLTTILDELELCGFIRAYLPFESHGSKKRNHEKTSPRTLYQLVDFYSLFYLKFHDRQDYGNERFWSSMTNSPVLNTWRGLTFEMLCLWHVNKIKEALGIGDVSASVCSWTGDNVSQKVQIDLLIDRKDETINLCEMKFTFGEFVIDKKYAENLRRKLDVFMAETGTRKNILMTLISTHGVKNNTYSDIVQRHVCLDQLF